MSVEVRFLFLGKIGRWCARPESHDPMIDYLLPLAGLALVHLLAVASPGQSILLVIQTAAGSGRRAGLLAAFGMMVGALAWASAALYGLRALSTGFEWLQVALRVLGGGYLLYLAVMLWRHAGAPGLHGSSG